MTFGRHAAVLALLVFFAAGIYAAVNIRNAVDTDILSLLPGDARDPVLADALQRASAEASNRVAFAIEGGAASTREEAAADLSARLAATGLFRPASADAEALWRWLFANRSELLCSADRDLLLADKGEVIAHQALLQWYGPMSMGGGRLIVSDPMFLTNRLLGCVVPAGFRVMPETTAVILSGSIGGSVFRLDVQDRIGRAVEDWHARWSPRGLTLARAGAVFHAAYGAAQARKEMSVIGGLTTAAVLLLYWLMFRSLRAPVIAVSMIAYSLTIGVAVTLAVFGRIHAMALVFGAALIGMVVDYTTYYLVTGLGTPARTPSERRAHIVKPLTLGMLTSVGAFAALFLFPIPAFQQIALLGGAGLVAAWAATLTLTPVVEGGRMKVGPGAAAIERKAGRFLAGTPSRRLGMLILATAALITLLGYSQGGVLDDVRRFQAPSPVLAAEEKRIRTLTGFATSGAFYLVKGASAAETTAHEEALLAALDRAGASGDIAWAASRLDPSVSERAANAALLKNRLFEPQLPALLRALGAGNAKAYDRVGAPEAELPDFVASLRGQTNGVFWSIVPVAGVPKVTAPANPAWQFVEPAERYSELLEKYRMLATMGLAGSVVSTGLMLIAVYRRISALRMMLPTVIALLVTPAITALIGLPFSFFSAMGLFLVVGAGVDYAIFQWEHPSEAGKWTRVGIVLAAVMTCISVGLLGLSSVLPVKSLGVTVSVGIFLSLVLSPLVRRWDDGPGLWKEKR
jgi:predicted exporter